MVHQLMKVTKQDTELRKLLRIRMMGLHLLIYWNYSVALRTRKLIIAQAGQDILYVLSVIID